MFAKLKKKLAEEASIAPRSAGRIPRSISKESITSAGADSGDDFASDGSSSRDDLSSQLLRRNDLIRKLEAKLSDYAEQLRVLQKTKEKLEIALENHQDSSLRKLQDQNETYQASRAKMAEGMALALAKKDQEWMEKVAVLEKEKAELSSQLDDLTEQRLSLFQKRDDLDELEGFQRQELAKLKHMLLRKEEQVSQREQELERQASKLHEAHTALAQAQDKIRLLEEAQQESPRLNLGLQAEREKFLGLRAEDEKKISELEARSQQLQDVIQQVTQDFQKSRGTVAELERTISSLQAEHEALKLQHEQHRQKAAVAEEEKERLVLELQEKVSLLKRRLQGNLTEDEHLEELLKEKSALEQKVEETRAELVEARTSHTNEVSSLEAQVRALEQQVLEFQTTLKSNEQQAIDREAHLQMLQAEWSVSSECLRKKDQETVARLEAQVTMVEVARDIDRSAAQHRISELELEEEMLVQARDEAESELRRLAAELEQARAELNSRQMVSLEVAKSLEVMTRQKEELQEQVGETTSTLKAREDELATVTEQLVTREAELHTLREELQVAGTNLAELQAEVERQSRRAQECEAQLEALGQEALTQNQQVSDLEAEVETLTEQLRAPALCRAEQNGVVAVDDLARVQRINRELEQQLSEKNKTIKQLQQRHAELKRTLQKELKLRPEAEAEGKEKRQEAKADKPERPSRLCPEAPGPGPPGGVVTNNTDLSDGREINFEYLKHVVLKFMSSRETEAYQLIRAVSVLLNFTREEEAMLKETLEYKMSWFGSKPSPRGIVRPSISGASTHWR